MKDQTKPTNLGNVVSVRGSVVDVRFDAQLRLFTRCCGQEMNNRSLSKCWRSAMRGTCEGLR